MRTLQDYKSIYSEIGSNLGLRGDTLEVLVQLLSQASYISEVEQVVYVQEASLEKATLVNSKIQHCMNLMYSVYRGSCPRVILNIHPTKYFSLNPYDEIVSSNNFKVYYLGYWDENKILDPSTQEVQAVYAWDKLEDPIPTPPDGKGWFNVDTLPNPTEDTVGLYYRTYYPDATTYWGVHETVGYVEINSIPGDVYFRESTNIQTVYSWPPSDNSYSYYIYVKSRYYICQMMEENGENVYYWTELESIPPQAQSSNFQFEVVDYLPEANSDRDENTIYQVRESVTYYQKVTAYEWYQLSQEPSVIKEDFETLPEPKAEYAGYNYRLLTVIDHFLGVEEKESKSKLTDTSLTGGFIYSQVTIQPEEGKVVPIIGLLASETINLSHDFEVSNPYYAETLDEENLSNDVYVTWDGSRRTVTRSFSDHILNGSIFDLTLPSYGSRLYVPAEVGGSDSETGTVNTHLDATYFRYSYLSDYNLSELKKMYIKGAEFVKFPTVSDIDVFGSGYSNAWKVFANSDSEIADGIITVQEGARDSLVSIHYKANRDRYVNSIFRSNSDVTNLLEEMYPDYIVSGGTSYQFSYVKGDGTTNLQIWYVPKNRQNLLTQEDIKDWKSKRNAYYITSVDEEGANNIIVEPGTCYRVIFNIELELYREDDNTLDDQIQSILSGYENKFRINLKEAEPAIESLISKISNVRQIFSIERTWVDMNGKNMLAGDGASEFDPVSYDSTYYDIVYNLTTTVQASLI